MVEPIFAGPAAQSLNAVELEGVTLLYHRNAGATHVVTEPLPEIIGHLSSGPATVSALLGRMGLDEDQNSKAALLARLDELEASGLISRQ